MKSFFARHNQEKYDELKKNQKVNLREKYIIQETLFSIIDEEIEWLKDKRDVIDGIDVLEVDKRIKKLEGMKK